MKNLLTATLPALALLALGGCATTGAVTSTEDDGIYYSSKDRTTVAPAAAGSQTNGYGYETARVQTQSTQAAPIPATEDANPDYQGGTTTTAGNADYYDDSYTSASPSGFGQPYSGPGVSSYNYTPNWSVSPAFYGSPFGYGTGLSLGYGYGGGFGSYGYPGYGGFYDPFYSPFGFGYGSGLSIGFGYGFGGFGGFGYPYGGYGSRYGYGYSPYSYGYGGGYGGDYYGGGYGGARRYVYNNALVNGGYPNGYDRGAVHVGRREVRATNAMGSGVVNGAGYAPAGAGVVGGRNRMDGGAGVVGGGGVVGTTPTMGGGRGRGMNAVDMPTSATGVSGQNAMNGDGRGQRFDQSTVNPNSPGAAQGRRGGFFREMFANPANGGGNVNNGSGNASNGGNANNQSGYSRPQRTYSQPDRSFSQPQPRMEQRSYQPAQSPSFGGSRSGGNFGGGGGGGGNFGGGGGGGGRRGR